MIRDQPHYGCPKCGSPEFSTKQSITSYGSETVRCTYTTTSQDEPPDFDIEEATDTDYDDTEAGDMDDEKTCEDCGHEYIEPVFYGPRNSLEGVAERSGIAVEELAPLGCLIELFASAHSIVVRQEPHATIVAIEPSTIQRGYGRKQWTVNACPRCNCEIDEPNARVRQVRDGNSKLSDRRQLPVLVHAALCRSCDSLHVNL
jgi:predicted  nucleic acid-binding Zn-ribbon protein